MKNLLLGLALVSLLGCSKDVSREGSRFAVSEDPNPTTLPSPNPTPTGGPLPSFKVCDPDLIGDLNTYSALVREDLNLKGVITRKRVAAADALVHGAIIGRKLAVDATRPDLATTQTLGVRGALICHGKATYGSSIERKRSSARGGFENSALDLSSELQTLSDFSEACRVRSTNTTVERKCKHSGRREKCTVTIRGENPLNIAELSTAEIENVRKYVIDIPSGSSLVTNLPETQDATFKGVKVRFTRRSRTANAAPRIYWNFPAGDRLNFKGTCFRGTIVAPDANVNVAGQHGESAYWVRELKAAGSSW
jgi:choice-of-anchor A domain-containing protein